MDLLWTIIVVIVGGIIIGLLGKFLAPGDKDNIPLWLTILCGIGGMLLGTFLYSLFFDPATKGIDWWRHLWQIVTAAILVVIASTVTGRNSGRSTATRTRV